MSLTTRFTLVEPSDRVASLAIGKLPSDLATLAETIVEEVRTDIPPSPSDITPRLSVKPLIMIGRRPCRQRRNVGFYAAPGVVEGYHYSGTVMKACPLTPSMAALIDAV